jgi:hypothetical protein
LELRYLFVSNCCHIPFAVRSLNNHFLSRALFFSFEVHDAQNPLVLRLIKDVPFAKAILFVLITLPIEVRLKVVMLLEDTLWNREERHHNKGRLFKP